MSGLRVIKPGPLSTLQDGGRWGQAQLGLTSGGPMDGQAFINANRLLGNADDATALEITLGGVKLQAHLHTQLAFCGEGMSFSINGHLQPTPHAVRVNAGDIVQIDNIATTNSENGCRAYLAISGGFITPPMFGSTATVVREGLGGLAGRALQANDWLPCKPRWPRHTTPKLQNNRNSTSTFNVVCGFQFEQFSAMDQAAFFQNEYTVSPQIDRMGYRLTGSPLTPPKASMLSEGITPGAIQIPPDGQPIVLLADRQTLGGYPKLGSVIQSDRWRMTQLKPRAILRFAPISAEEAHRQLINRRIDYL